MPHAREGFFEAGEEVALGAALEDFRDKGAAWAQHGRCKSKGLLGQRDDAQMVGRGMAGRGRRHVAQDEIGGAAERRPDALGRGGVAEIALEQGRARDRVGCQQIDADHRAAVLAGADPGGSDLGPAARGAAEIDNAHPGPQQMKPLVELDQLKRGARAIAQTVRLGDKRVVELAVEPFGRGGLAPPGAPYLDGERPRTATLHATSHQVTSSRSTPSAYASFFIVAVVPLRAPVSSCDKEVKFNPARVASARCVRPRYSRQTLTGLAPARRRSTISAGTVSWLRVDRKSTRL